MFLQPLAQLAMIQKGADRIVDVAELQEKLQRSYK